jgi:hypothetical protein
MAWSLDKARGVWKCSSYSDLNYAEINNLAEYGQPRSPYESGFNHTFVPDFAKVIIEMPQLEVMNNGYGQRIRAESFSVVEKFLRESLPFPFGTYDFPSLVRFGFAKTSERRIATNLYGWGGHGVTSGNINAGDAAYIHGTVGLALMQRTRFTCNESTRRVDAEIGAMDDNWDFNSSSIPPILNATVATLLGPDHYNLTEPIRINYTGPGRMAFVERPAPRSFLQRFAPR